jgi:tetratricopeptide (TPR) repeat protein
VPTIEERPREFKYTSTLVWVVLALVLAGAIFFAYRRVQPERLATKARTYLERDDHAGAMLTAQRALQLDPLNLSAMRVMAEYYEHQGADTAQEWRQKIAQLNPGSATDILAWARVALEFGDMDSAREALERVPERDRTSAEYHARTGLLMLMTDDSAKAREHLNIALKLAPKNEEYLLYFAQAHLQDSDDSTKAVQLLEKLARGSTVSLPARRALIDHLIQLADFSSALGHAKEVAANPAADFGDRLLYVELLQRNGSPDFRDQLSKIQQEARDEGEESYELLTWMIEHGLTADALQWVSSLPADVKADPGVNSAIAKAYVNIENWDALTQLTKSADWKHLEALRLAYRARAAQEKGDDTAFRADWNAAITAAIKEGRSLLELHNLVESWGWTQGLRELWWAAAEHSSHPDWALAKLNDIYFSEGDTEGLRRVAGRMLERNSSDRNATNNFAICSLLLGLDLQRASDLARDLYQSDPTNAVFASTYAYALHMQGRPGEALQLMNSLPKEQLEQPEIAAYYGLFLATNGETERARHFLSIAKQAELLPEEKKLLIAAEGLASPNTGNLDNF